MKSRPKELLGSKCGVFWQATDFNNCCRNKDFVTEPVGSKLCWKNFKVLFFPKNKKQKNKSNLVNIIMQSRAKNIILKGGP